MGMIGEIQAPPDELFRMCEWDDGCYYSIDPDDENYPLCKEHSDEARREDAADTARKMVKEDEI